MSNEISAEKLFPVITETNKKFYESLEIGNLVANKCCACENVFLPPAKNCPKCLSVEVEWIQLSGEGTIYSWVEYKRSYHEVFKDRIPYVVAIIQLKEGARMISNIINYNVDELKVGTPVEAVFTKGYSNFPLVQFKPLSIDK